MHSNLPAIRPRLVDRSRQAFPMLVLLAAGFSAGGGIQAVPPRDVPAYALDSAIIYKCEVALALFVALYLLLVAVALAFEGRTVGKITTTGFELPSELSSSVVGQQALIERQDQAEQALYEQDGRLSQEIERIWEKLERERVPSRGGSG